MTVEVEVDDRDDDGGRHDDDDRDIADAYAAASPFEALIERSAPVELPKRRRRYANKQTA